MIVVYVFVDGNFVQESFKLGIGLSQEAKTFDIKKLNKTMTNFFFGCEVYQGQKLSWSRYSLRSYTTPPLSLLI